MLPERYSHVTLDVFQIMPNHIHAIIALNATPVGATLAVALNNDMNTANGAMNANGMMNANRATARVAPTIGNVVGAYKSLVMNKCLEIYKSTNE